MNRAKGEGGANPSLLPVKPVYTKADWDGDPGSPGLWPYLRGIQPTMYTGRLWTMRQYAGFGTAEETNRRFRALLAAGQTGLSTAFDLPTQMGYDSDHPMAEGEVGRVGVAIDTVDDLDRLFEGIPLDLAVQLLPGRTFWNLGLFLHLSLSVQLDLREFEGMVPEEMFGRSAFPRVGKLPYLLTFGPRGFFWFQLKEAKQDEEEETQT